MPDPIDITVEGGTTTKAAIITTIASGLGAAGLGITTAVGALPDGVSPAIGATLTTVAGVLTAASLGILAASRNFWAARKAEVMAATIVTEASNGSPKTAEGEPDRDLNDPTATDNGDSNPVGLDGNPVTPPTQS